MMTLLSILVVVVVVATATPTRCIVCLSDLVGRSKWSSSPSTTIHFSDGNNYGHIIHVMRLLKSSVFAFGFPPSPCMVSILRQPEVGMQATQHRATLDIVIKRLKLNRSRCRILPMNADACGADADEHLELEANLDSQ